MVSPFLDTPQSERNDQSRVDKTNFDVDFSLMPSFASPAKRDDNLLNQIRGMGGTNGNRILATPRARQPLGERKNPPGKNEFTPLLKSATTNRTKQIHNSGRQSHIKTPEALKPDFKVDVTPLPEQSVLSGSSVVEDDGTPVPPIASSSVDLSTPMILPRRGEGGFGDGGNVLTLREQEAKLEQIDKENFGLKLKIHFLEENLKRTGPEANQIAIRENSELKSNKMILERELKRYQKHLKTADLELEQYRQQLLDYADKVKRRHMSEEMLEEMEGLRQRIEEQDADIKSMREQVRDTTAQEAEIEKIKGDLDDAERQIREKDAALEEQEEELQDLKAASESQGSDGAQLQEKDKKIEEQADQIEELQDELRRLTQDKDAEVDQLEDRLAEEREEHATALRDLQDQLDKAAPRDGAGDDDDLQDLQQQLRDLEREKETEIESLEDRLRLAEASTEQQTQLAEQAAEEARGQLGIAIQEKDAEIKDLQFRLGLAENSQNGFDETKKQLLHQFEEAKNLHRKNEHQAVEIETLTAKLASMNTELHSLRGAVDERNVALNESASLQNRLSEVEQELKSSKEQLESFAHTKEALQHTRGLIVDRERQIETLKTTLQERAAELEALRETEVEPHSQLDAVNNLVRERSSELDNVRESHDALQGKLDEVQKLAEERNATLLALKEELATTKQNLEDEIQVLESSLDDAEEAKDLLQSKIDTMQEEMQASYELRDRIEPLEKDLRTAEREKTDLEQEIESLEKDLEMADEERLSLQDKIKSLTKDLDTLREDAHSQSPRSQTSLAGKLRASQDLVDSLKLQLADKQDLLNNAEAKLTLRGSPSSARKLQQECDALKATVEVKSRELKSVEQKAREDLHELEKKHTDEARQSTALLRSATTELEAVRRRLADKEGRLTTMNAETAALLKEKDRKLRLLHNDKQNGRLSAQLQAQETETLQLELTGLRSRDKEFIKLRGELVESERRHAAELKGLARQIQWLRAKGAREEGFREMLCYEKRWMNMQINMFGACNRENLRLLQDMGITPDITIHDRRPRLKTVGLAVIAAIRMKRWQTEWAANRKLQDSLMKKLDSMRRSGLRKNSRIVR